MNCPRNSSCDRFLELAHLIVNKRRELAELERQADEHVRQEHALKGEDRRGLPSTKFRAPPRHMTIDQ